MRLGSEREGNLMSAVEGEEGVVSGGVGWWLRIWEGSSKRWAGMQLWIFGSHPDIFKPTRTLEREEGARGTDRATKSRLSFVLANPTMS